MEQAVKAVNVREAGRMLGGAGRSMIYKLLAEVNCGASNWAAALDHPCCRD